MRNNLAIVAIVAACSAGIGMSVYAMSEIGTVKITQAEIERTLDGLEQKVVGSSEKIVALQEKVRNSNVKNPITLFNNVCLANNVSTNVIGRY